MRLRLLAVAALLVLALVVPTAAVTGDGTDEIGDAVALSPSEGPNGEYATVGGGQLRIDFEALNEDTETTAHDVFTVTATTDEPIEVWVEANASEAVTAYEGDDPDARLDREGKRRLRPGETLRVGFRIDTHGEFPESGTVTVGVRFPGNDRDDGGDSPESGGPATQTPTSGDGPPVVVDPETGVEVVFEGDGKNPPVEETTVRSLDSLPEDGTDSPPRAVVDRGALLSGRENDGLSVHGTELVARQHERVRLTGTRSYISTAAGVARKSKPAAIVDITPPEELRNSPATVRIRVARENFTATNATRARIGRHTSDGWQLIPTRVVETTDETVLLEARTHGFSVFTVFAESQVEYEWTLPDGRTVAEDELRTSFDEPGYHRVRLTVTDAFGRSGDARQRILVNDPPAVTIETASNDTSGAETTLRANVTNEVGNVTVTWTLPDGSTATGETVAGSFAPGETVSVTVEDEFGATAGAETTVGDPTERAGVTFLPLSMSSWLYLLLSVSSVALAAGVARSETSRRAVGAAADLGRAALSALGDDPPRITRFENPRWNPDAERVEIDALEVTASGGVLRSVELTITDAEGTPLVTRTVDVGAQASYSASPEYVPVYGGLAPSEGGYRIRVRAIDENDRTGTADRSPEWPVGVPT